MSDIKLRLLNGATAIRATLGLADSDDAAPAPKANAGGGGSEEETQVVTVADMQAQVQAAEARGNAAGIAAGKKAERERTAAVMGSDAGKANYAMAAFMLNSNPDATADAINGHLGTLAPQGSKETPETDEQRRLKASLETIPPIKTSGGKEGANDGGEEAPSSESVWKDVREKRGALTTGGAMGFAGSGGKGPAVVPRGS